MKTFKQAGGSIRKNPRRTNKGQQPAGNIWKWLDTIVLRTIWSFARLSKQERIVLLLVIGTASMMVLVGVSLLVSPHGPQVRVQVPNPPLSSVDNVVSYLKSLGLRVEVQGRASQRQAEKSLKLSISQGGLHGEFTLFGFDSAARAGREAFLITQQTSVNNPLSLTHVGNMVLVTEKADEEVNALTHRLVSDFLMAQPRPVSSSSMNDTQR